MFIVYKTKRHAALFRTILVAAPANFLFFWEQLLFLLLTIVKNCFKLVFKVFFIVWYLQKGLCELGGTIRII